MGSCQGPGSGRMLTQRDTRERSRWMGGIGPPYVLVLLTAARICQDHRPGHPKGGKLAVCKQNFDKLLIFFFKVTWLEDTPKISMGEEKGPAESKSPESRNRKTVSPPPTPTSQIRVTVFSAEASGFSGCKM